jgi:hypothetical protein
LLLRDGQVHPDTHAIPMGNYVIRVGNYVSVSPSNLENYVSADTGRQDTAVVTSHGALVTPAWVSR